ncbi:MAG: hypothetical protein ABF629_08670 [Sporolactobacillus sp.]
MESLTALEKIGRLFGDASLGRVQSRLGVGYLTLAYIDKTIKSAYTDHVDCMRIHHILYEVVVSNENCKKA